MADLPKLTALHRIVSFLRKNGFHITMANSGKFGVFAEFAAGSDGKPCMKVIP
jgi:hypothetical protein